MHIHYAGAVLFAAYAAALPAGDARAQSSAPIFADQGPNWSDAERFEFYSRDQGSNMIALEWLRALLQPDDSGPLANSLARYGYLPNAKSAAGLPVGFTASGPQGAQQVGMTCSACHTRQITFAGQAYRIDGGPGMVDFQSLLSDLDAAAGKARASDAAFTAFAAKVLGEANPDPDSVASLRQEFESWYLRYHTLMTKALPSQHPWGPGRLDAVGMIFNRLTGLDLGQGPSFLIEDNIQQANAPVRYPFLWNAARQDKTQWSGFAANGDDIKALGRNLGEVFGVFGIFQPAKAGFLVNFLNNNSANFDGLSRNEELIKLIGPPKWPWPVDNVKAAGGKAIYDQACGQCHGITPGAFTLSLTPSWATPVWDVDTDTKQYEILSWRAKTGALEGAFVPGISGDPLLPRDTAFNVLKTSVTGSIAEHLLTGGGFADAQNEIASALRTGQPLSRRRPSLQKLEGMFTSPGAPLSATERLPQLNADIMLAAPAPAKGAYESRVLQGIWAAAPYLHNGSVRSLAELLTPPAQRASAFKVGPEYDPDAIGLAKTQTQFNFEIQTTDCSDRNSGNSRCGHVFGTALPDVDKKALLEYLKTL